MAISTITYAVDKVKTTWAYLETIMPAAYNELNRVVKELVTNNNALQALLNLKAPLASPALTGTPTAPTPATADSSTKIATTAFVKNNQANAYIIEHYENGDDWYNKYSNGWIEQGGKMAVTSQTNITINFITTFTASPTNVKLMPWFGTTQGEHGSAPTLLSTTLTTAEIRTGEWSSGQVGTLFLSWEACGK